MPRIPHCQTQTSQTTLPVWKKSIRRLKNGRAAGADDIPPELLKCAIDPVSRALHGLFCTVWKSGKVPTGWKEGCLLYTSPSPRD